MTGAEASAGVAMEVFMEHNQVAPMWIDLKLLQVAEHRPAAVGAAQKDASHAAGKFTGYLPELHEFSGASGKFDFEIIPQVVMKFLQGFNKQIVHRKPDWSPPVGISAEEPGSGFSRLVINSVDLIVHCQSVGMVAMEL